jgi:cell division protein FtsZ
MDGDRPGRFAFNNLIHRMTGSARDQPQAAPAPLRREPSAAAPATPADEEDARMEIPAFLRRQAN